MDTRRMRRLGKVTTRDGHEEWVGFAGLARTTVERLLREGALKSEDVAASETTTQSHTLATVRHVLGGECAKLDITGVRDAVRALERHVVRAGGAVSELRALVSTARAYVELDDAARASSPDAGWQALRRLYACDVPAPDWPLPGGMTDEETLEAEAARDKIIVTEFMGLVRLASELRTAWRDAAAPRVQWRDRREASRGIMRVIVRAWRELTDGMRAGTARWEGHWSSSDAHAPLARRLKFPAKPSVWAGEPGWRVRMVLAWQRLVRQDAVRLRRRRSPQGRAEAKARVDSTIYLGWSNSAHTLGVQAYDWREELKEYNSTHTPSARVYDWREELTEQARGRNMGSGASAVLVRRQLAAHATTSSPQLDTPVTDSSRKRPRAAVEEGAPGGAGQGVAVATLGPAQGGDDGERAGTRDGTHCAGALDESAGGMGAAHSAAHAGTLGQGGVRRRAVDGLLAFNPQSRARMERVLGVWWRPLAPFGDG